MNDATSTMFQWASQLPAPGLYTFVFAWLFVESTGFPLSDEPLLVFVGYLSIHNTIGLVPVVVVALIGKVLASCIAYWIGGQIPLTALARPSLLPARSWQKLFFYLRPPRGSDSSGRGAIPAAWSLGCVSGTADPWVTEFHQLPSWCRAYALPLLRGRHCDRFPCLDRVLDGAGCGRGPFLPASVHAVGYVELVGTGGRCPAARRVLALAPNPSDNAISNRSCGPGGSVKTGGATRYLACMSARTYPRERGRWIDGR